ncbi:hypothetical protein ACOSQ4_021672 [Xanthoceras sorbifolium]
MLATSSFVGKRDIATKDAFDWASSNPNIIKTSSTISRLMDDKVSHEVPTMEEYMYIALLNCGHTMLATSSFVKMEDIATKDASD